jgi:hypothetical protein
MYLCETSNHPIPHRSWFFRRIKYNIRHLAKPGMTFLKAMVTPETTTPPTAAVASENSWFGAVKTLFWIANAIIIGMIMAKIC